MSTKTAELTATASEQLAELAPLCGEMREQVAKAAARVQAEQDAFLARRSTATAVAEAQAAAQGAQAALDALEARLAPLREAAAQERATAERKAQRAALRDAIVYHATQTAQHVEAARQARDRGIAALRKATSAYFTELGDAQQSQREFVAAFEEYAGERDPDEQRALLERLVLDHPERAAAALNLGASTSLNRILNQSRPDWPASDPAAISFDMAVGRQAIPMPGGGVIRAGVPSSIVPNEAARVF